MRQRHALVTSRGGLGFGVSHQFRVPAGGESRFPPFLWVCWGREARLFSRVSAVKAALQSELLVFPQNGGSSAVFQNFPQSAQAPTHSGGGTNLTGFAATVQSTDFHWPNP